MGVGSSLCLVKHSRLDIANVTREWQKANSDPNPAAFKEFPCVIKYVLNTKNVGLKLQSNGNANKP